ncbi:zinc finger protein [Pyricularia oryzae 70-15]|uniref:Zinc finger protein n=1 Tax=Pyricularia oryzae (strain 70-15 / ATCC MYA-4617 / FGSC 8958) TaxID=242507 RepID=G4MPF0_PYRO7|nr:zinc finger protein [Pyricularia oryzae 70-15]EHA57203.1 zinc finger protein [Pyricularia oryzae 70-15]
MPYRQHIDREDFAMMYPDPPHGAFSAASNSMEHLNLSTESYYPRQQQQEFHPTMTFDTHGLYADVSGVQSYGNNPGLSPSIYADDACAPGLHHIHSAPPSVDSAPSSAVGSPRSAHGQPQNVSEWPSHGNLMPGIVGHGDFYSAHEYSYSTGATQAMDDFSAFEYAQQPHTKPGFVADPTLIHPGMQNFESSYPPPPSSGYPTSPGLTTGSPQHRNGSISPLPYLPNSNYHHQQQHFGQFPASLDTRRQSIHSFVSGYSAAAEPQFSGDEAAKEKQRCPHPECGKIFKDLKAHMLTHQTERPEKCPIATCDYHIKGFARKYDKNRHTLTHYKGTMVCGFCPGSGSAAEKSFNRADVFKRHLTAVHGVEQTPPNSRKKSGSGAAAKKLSSYAPDATGKCSTCSGTFTNAQEFYEHLDDCVLRIVQQEDPAEAINAKRLAEVADDKEVHMTLDKNNLPTATMTTSMENEDEDEDMMDDEDLPSPGTSNKRSKASRGMTSSRIGITPPQAKRRKGRRDYPTSWGFDKGQMNLKKRTITAFDGSRRLNKDEFWVPTDKEVRINLLDGKSYVTDVDVRTLERANGFLNATDAEKGHWDSENPATEQMMLRGL